MLVSLTVAQRAVPVCLALRLVLLAAWVADAARRQSARVPTDVIAPPKGQRALDELDRVRAAVARFGWGVAEAADGKAAALRQGLQDRNGRWGSCRPRRSPQPR